MAKYKVIGDTATSNNENEIEYKKNVNKIEDNKKTGKKTKKVKKGSVIAKKFKETVSELKKVSWPNFYQVVKKTGVVFGFVIIIFIILFLVDFGLQYLHSFLVG